MRPTDEKLMEETRKDLDEKANEACKTFNSAKVKFQKEKDKRLKMNIDLNEIINCLFEGNRSNANDENKNVLKDLKLFVTMKSTKGDEHMPIIVGKLC